MKNRVVKVAVAIILVMVMTISDFIFVGKSLITYAIESDSTNHENVKFAAYFKTGEEELTHAQYKIDSGEMKLYIKVEVQNEGYFDGAITLENSNFKLKQDQISEYISKTDGNTITLNRVRAGNTAEIELAIEPVVEENYGENMLNKESVLKLTGDYKDNTENNVSIEAEKKVTLSLLAPSNLDTLLEGNVITNKKFKIGNNNKRLVQIELNSTVISNAYPIKATTFELQIPEGAQILEVISKGTYATNGEADRKLEEKSYQYREEDSVLELTIENTSKDGKISWKRDAIDSIIVTLILSEEAVIEQEYIAKAKIDFYGQEQKTEEKEIKYNLIEEADGIIRASTENKEEIYKGKIYSKEEKEYHTTTNIEINYASLIEESIIEEKTIYRTEVEDKQANIEYKSTIIKKAEIEKILGQEGIVTIKNGEEEIAKITKDTAVDENGNIVVNYGEGIKELKVEITKAVETGIIRLNHTKVIKTEQYSQEQIQQLKNLVEQATVKYNGVEKSKFEERTELKDITSEVALTIIPETISAEESKQMQIAITLKTDKEAYELFENPIFKITMPEGVTISSLSEGVITATNEALEISKLEVINSKEIRLEIVGKQEKYVTSNINTQISFTANIEIEKLMPNKTDTIKMQYANKGKIYSIESKTINIIASNSKVVTHLKVENYNQPGNTLERYSYSQSEVAAELPVENTELIQVPVKYTIINNHTSPIEVMPMMVATLTDKYGKEHTLLTYAETQVTIEAGNMYTIEKILQIPAGLYYSEKVDIETLLEYKYSGTSYKLRNDIKLATEAKQGIRTMSAVANKIQLEVFAQLGDGTGIKENDEVYNEQIIQYIIEVTNISNETISNLVVTNTHENGNIYDLKDVWVTDRITDFIEHEYGELDTNIKSFEIDTLNPGESEELICRVVAKKTAQSNITTANISISANGIEEKIVQKLSNRVKDAKIKVSTRNALKDEVILYANDTLYALTTIKNLTNEKIENIKIRKYMTDGLTYLEGDSPSVIDSMDEEETPLDILEEVTYQEEYVEYIITKLEANQELELLTAIHSKELPLDKMDSNEKVYVIADNIIANNFDLNIKQVDTALEVVQTVNINSEQKLKNGEKIIITGKIQNIGYIDTDVIIEDDLPDGIEAIHAEFAREDGINKIVEAARDYVYIDYDIVTNGNNEENKIPIKISAGETITIKIEAVVNTARIVEEELTNKIYATPSRGDVEESNEIIIKIDLEKEPETDDSPEIEVPEDKVPDIETPKNPDEIPEKPGESDIEKPDDPTPDDPNPDDPGTDKPTPDDPNPENPDDGNEKIKYRISGHAWVDSNGNATKDNNEGIKYVTVKIIDIDNNNTFLKDKDGKDIEVKTSATGAYTIENIPKGKYNLIFKYDTSMYEIQTNAMIKDYIIEGTQEKVAITNNINLNSDMTINLQLEELTEFDLQIDKYISKVIVQTANETKTTGYTNKQLVKEEIQSKYLAGATVLVEYTMQISNVGELTGYVTEIIDYLPNDMKFHSELNTQWYIGEDGNLYNTSLASSPLNPGETKVLKLVLVKGMNKDNTGTTSNVVEISNSRNIKEYSDKDSSNNQSKAEIIINPSTGTIMAYTISFIMATAIVLMGVYIIRKKVVGKEQVNEQNKDN